MVCSSSRSLQVQEFKEHEIQTVAIEGGLCNYVPVSGKRRLQSSSSISASGYWWSDMSLQNKKRRDPCREKSQIPWAGWAHQNVTPLFELTLYTRVVWSRLKSTSCWLHALLLLLTSGGRPKDCGKSAAVVLRNIWYLMMWQREQVSERHGRLNTKQWAALISTSAS